MFQRDYCTVDILLLAKEIKASKKTAWLYTTDNNTLIETLLLERDELYQELSRPNQRRIEFEGLGVLPEEEASIKEAEKEIITYVRHKPAKEKKHPVRLPLPDFLRREVEIIEPEGIDENWERIGEEVTEMLAYKPGELFVRKIIRPTYALKKNL